MFEWHLVSVIVQCDSLLVLLGIHATAAAAVLAVDSCCKAIAVQLQALGLLAVAPFDTTASQAPI